MIQKWFAFVFLTKNINILAFWVLMHICVCVCVFSLLLHSISTYEKYLKCLMHYSNKILIQDSSAELSWTKLNETCYMPHTANPNKPIYPLVIVIHCSEWSLCTHSYNKWNTKFAKQILRFPFNGILENETTEVNKKMTFPEGDE